MNDFITKVENENGIQKLAKVECPMVKGYDAYDTTSPLLTEEEQHKFRSLIGTLLYAANTARPDICFAVNLLSQFLVASRRTHLKAGYKVLHYLIQTKDRGIIYGGSGIPLEFRDFRLLDKSRNITTDDYPKPTNYTVTTLSDSDYATSC